MDTQPTSTRREVLAASAALSIAGALAAVPLTHAELRILAMSATPAEAWEGREHEYSEDTGRIVSPGTELHQAVLDLETRGLLTMVPTPYRDDMDWKAIATPAGIEALRHAGVEV